MSSSDRRARMVGEFESSESVSYRRARVVGELEDSEWSESSSHQRARVLRRARVVEELDSSKSSSRRRALSGQRA